MYFKVVNRLKDEYGVSVMKVFMVLRESDDFVEDVERFFEFIG